jgi:hypothetical protein
MGLILDVQAKAAVPGGREVREVREAPDLTGTKWQFPGTATVVEFLKGGQVRFGDTKSPGKWRQKGKTVVFDCNDYTLFELEFVNADEMTGTWRRLQGEDVGQKNPSGLKRLKP